jgi:hypothetical protein
MPGTPASDTPRTVEVRKDLDRRRFGCNPDWDMRIAFDRTANHQGVPGRNFYDWTQSVVIMVVVIPITVRMPTMVVFIPPFMFRGPAVFPGLVQHVTPMFRLLALIAVVLDGFMQIVIGFRNAVLAVVSAQVRSACKYEKSGQCRCSKCGSSEERIV